MVNFFSSTHVHQKLRYLVYISIHCVLLLNFDLLLTMIFFHFQVHNIDNASPATVSRNGMVFMSSSALDWVPILKGWFLTRPNIESEVMMPLFEGVFEDVYEFWQINLVKQMSVLQCMVIKQVTFSYNIT